MEQSNLNTINQQNEDENPIKTHVLYTKISQKYPSKWPFKVNFKGWYKKHQSWAKWVEKLSIQHAKTWEFTGICDGILSSLHETTPNASIVLALCEHWCPETNTFLFPWGEATITLEDVCVLSGLPVVGESVNFPVSWRLSRALEDKLIMTCVDGRCSYTEWIKYFDVECRDVEHVGFLSFWLSRFVLPDMDECNVGSHVFPIAVNICRGVKVALAPAVLACLYRNLTFLSRRAADFDSNVKEVSVSGPFQIVQLWALERFPLLGSKLARPLGLGHPRVARWDNVSLEMKLGDVRSVLRSNDGFCGRPYALELENWRPRTCSLQNGKIVTALGDDDDELKSFRVFVQPQELVGIDCRQMYFPQRVAIQFESGQGIAVENAPLSSLESNRMRLTVVSRPNDTDNLGSESIGVLNACSNKDSERTYSEGKEEMSLVKSIVLDTGDEEVTNKSEYESAPLSSLESNHMSLIVGSGTKDTSNLGNESIRGLNACSNKDSSKRMYSEDIEEMSLVNVIVLDPDDEEVTNRLEYENAFRRNAKKVKKTAGGSAENPLYVAGFVGKAHNCLKRLGFSFEHPIDVESYFP